MWRKKIQSSSYFSKAYGRMGLAHSSLNKHKEAVDNFKKALELEPDNDSYKSNLQIAEDKVSSGVSVGGPGTDLWTNNVDLWLVDTKHYRFLIG